MTSHKVSGEFWHGVPNSIAGRKALHPQRARESGAGISERPMVWLVRKEIENISKYKYNNKAFIFRMVHMKKPNRTLIISVLFVLASSAFFCLVLSSASFAYANSSSDDWPMFHHDLTHTGYSTSTPTATHATLLWNYTTNSVVGASPAIVDGLVYVGSDGGVAYCLNASDGVRNMEFHSRYCNPRVSRCRRPSNKFFNGGC